jgi:hypothetical protein
MFSVSYRRKVLFSGQPLIGPVAHDVEMAKQEIYKQPAQLFFLHLKFLCHGIGICIIKKLKTEIF